MSYHPQSLISFAEVTPNSTFLLALVFYSAGLSLLVLCKLWTGSGCPV